MWPNCIAVADGTLFPLTFAPQSNDAPDYSGCKVAYSLSVMIVNEDQKWIRYYLSGFPGSVHDNCVYNNTALCKKPEEYFGTKYCLLANLAIACSPTVVASFKAPRGHSNTAEQAKFNTQIGRPQITPEHSIGILKGRFLWLRSIPMVVTNNPRSMRRILKYIDCCIILHNLLIGYDDDIPED